MFAAAQAPYSQLVEAPLFRLPSQLWLGLCPSVSQGRGQAASVIAKLAHLGWGADELSILNGGLVRPQGSDSLAVAPGAVAELRRLSGASSLQRVAYLLTSEVAKLYSIGGSSTLTALGLQPHPARLALAGLTSPGVAEAVTAANRG